MPRVHILAIDQGTTGTTALLVEESGRIVGRGYAPVRQHYPRPGWVEHDPAQLWQTVLDAAGYALADVPQAGRTRLAAIGVTNQRETVVLWERASGRPIGNAVVWQDRRTAADCEALRAAGLEPLVQERTGLLLDPYFSGTKLRWLLNRSPGLRRRAADGEVLCGTVDSWLLWNLTGGQLHATDASNASRTLLLNLRSLDWDPELCQVLEVPRAMLPRVVPSSGVVGYSVGGGPIPAGIPVAGIAGDQQAALFGQACFAPGSAKTTYGTGCFLLLNTGAVPVASHNRLVTTVAWRLGEEVAYALEGSVFIGGAVVQWLRDELGLIATADESGSVARSVPDSGGVYLVPAFTGLGAPYWDPYARGLLIGLTRGAGRAHIVRAALESIAYQVADVVRAMAVDSALLLAEMRVDGGAAANDFLLQFQADMLDTPVVRPAQLETTALGAAYLAGLGTGVWSGVRELAANWEAAARFTPALDAAERESRLASWHRAVERARGWASQ